MTAPTLTRTRGFHRLMAAQFLSGLADNALLIVAIHRVIVEGGPAWAVPLLKLVFTLAYVVLAPLVGPLADRWPKARVMGVANATKAGACAAMAMGAPVLGCFCVAGAGAAVYSPAKYGLVTELVPPARLVAANGWIEVTTVLAIILGTVFGGALTEDAFLELARQWSALDSAHPASFAMLLGLYGLAALLNLHLPDSGARYRQAPPLAGQFRDFHADNARLWRDPLGQISLATTTLFWGVGAALQFLVLRWAQEKLGLSLAQATYLQGLSAVGVVLGAVVAGRWVALEHAPRVLGLGVLLGLAITAMETVQTPLQAALVLTVAGSLSGLFVVPLNALLQHRGCTLLSAGRSIAVQNFNENASVLVVLGLYTACVHADLELTHLMRAFGMSIALLMAAIAWRHHHLHRRGGSTVRPGAAPPQPLPPHPAPALIPAPSSASKEPS